MLEKGKAIEADKLGENNFGVVGGISDGVGGMGDGVGGEACEAMTDEAFCGVADITGRDEVFNGNVVEAINDEEFCEA